ncbi:hypothetical protein P5G51_011770 [Virgibacillus sp. 179-BFC.A HS]|uniref:Transposase n=1 Tax=Tigheibacillus jepli TaxID=3035914 RepID=A0ABU5CHZ6_9BACI|nr:hypothetical protein [Virgibacillus sp. 179-BFC.A HS]MDY0405973.1 hypothetical protein [Virgibacillus sp. 179-BFC.A HS]
MQSSKQKKKEKSIGKPKERENYAAFDASDQIASTISILEKMKSGFLLSNGEAQKQQQKQLQILREENEKLKEQLKSYETAWKEMGNLWNWVTNKYKS